jgi:hypothetical protein
MKGRAGVTRRVVELFTTDGRAPQTTNKTSFARLPATNHDLVQA